MFASEQQGLHCGCCWKEGEENLTLLNNRLCKEPWRKEVRCLVGDAKEVFFMPGNSRCRMSRNGMFSDALAEKRFPNRRTP